MLNNIAVIFANIHQHQDHIVRSDQQISNEHKREWDKITAGKISAVVYTHLEKKSVCGSFMFLFGLMLSFFHLSSVPSSVSGATCVVASTAAACCHISPPPCISSICDALHQRLTTASPPPATASRWWFVVAGNQEQDWGHRERGPNSQCLLCWRETRRVWDTDRWKEPKWLTSKPETVKLWNHHLRTKWGLEWKDRGRKKVGKKSKKTGTGKETSVPLFIFDTGSFTSASETHKTWRGVFY